MSHLNANNIGDNNQYGFRTGRSTEKAIFKLLEDISHGYNNDDTMGMIFPDVPKAFD